MYKDGRPREPWPRAPRPEVALTYLPELPGFTLISTGNALGATRWAELETLLKDRAPGRHTPIAQHLLGVFYESRNPAEAGRLFKLAADQGNAPAAYRISRMYHGGNGVAQNKKEAGRYLKQAADQELPHAEMMIALCYLGYNPVFALALGKAETGISQNLAEARRLFERLANKGMKYAECCLAFMFHTGTGVAKDLRKAVHWYTLAARQGVTLAQYNLGNANLRGDGVPKNVAEAVRWLQAAADNGHPLAQYGLGILYYNGSGTHGNPLVKDLAKSKHWVGLAAKQGCSQALTILPRIVQRMGAAGTAGGSSSGVAATATNLEPHAVGAKVVVHGLVKAPELNGRTGTVVR